MQLLIGLEPLDEVALGARYGQVTLLQLRFQLRHLRQTDRQTDRQNERERENNGRERGEERGRGMEEKKEKGTEG